MLAVMQTISKRVRDEDQAGAEAAGLRWLAEATDAVVTVVRADGKEIVTKRIDEVAPTPEAARKFGAELARMHRAGAAAFGSAPEGWEGKNFIGTIEQECTPTDDWGEFYTQQRVLPFAEPAGISTAQRDLVKRACDAIAARSWDVAPARIHGDLWAGNLLFDAQGGIMIDPYAHGGHPYTDLGMLALFGAPYIEEIFRGYGAPKDIET